MASYFCLTSLPPELLHQICSYLPSQCNVSRPSLEPGPYPTTSQQPSTNFSNLRLVCRYLNQVIEPIFFNEFVFDFHLRRSPIVDFETLLSSLSNGTSPVCEYTKHLQIRCLNPVQEGIVTGGRYWRKNRTKATDEDEKSARIMALIDVHLEKAGSSLRNLQSVTWQMYDDYQGTLVMNAISSLPHLEDVFIKFGEGVTKYGDLQINRLAGLRKLYIACPHFVPRKDAFPDHLAQVIGQSPLLTNLKISGPPLYPRCVSFDTLTKMVPASQPLRLKVLRHSISGLELNQRTIQYFGSLSSLTVFGMENNPECYNLWDTMRSAKIALKELSVDGISKPVLHYLASFSNLQKLDIRIGQNQAPLDSDIQFLFDDILPRHNESLRTIFLRSMVPTALIFDKDRANPLSICRNLTTCGVTLSMDAVLSSMKHLMDAILTSNGKRLDSLTLFHASPRRNPFNVCTKGSDNFRLHNEVSVLQWLSSLSINDPSHYPKQIVCGLYERQLEPNPNVPGTHVYR